MKQTLLGRIFNPNSEIDEIDLLIMLRTEILDNIPHVGTIGPTTQSYLCKDTTFTLSVRKSPNKVANFNVTPDKGYGAFYSSTNETINYPLEDPNSIERLLQDIKNKVT